MSDAEDFDSSKLDELKEYKDEHNQDLRFSIVEIYLIESKKLIHQLKNAKDSNTISQAAHSLKSSTASIGGTALSNIFEKLETQALADSEKAALTKEVDLHFLKLENSLKHYLKNSG